MIGGEFLSVVVSSVGVMVAVPFEERGVEETLDAVERLHETRLIAEAGMCGTGCR